MQTQIHGHEVIAMMLQSRRSYTRESLTAAIVAEFGASARFFTCSADGMTPAELIDFLEARGKFTSTADGFMIDAAQVCGHAH
jgi:probable metal-binding protein